MNLINWTPFGETDDLYDRLISNVFRPSGLRFLGADLQWRPTADIFETEKEYSIKLDLPDVKKKDVSVGVSGDILTIKGERPMQKDTEDEKQHRRESYYGSFSRSFSLPENVDVKRVKATSKDGVLRIVLPKTTERRAKPLEIDVQ
jgi:HSP20 family protein